MTSELNTLLIVTYYAHVQVEYVIPLFGARVRQHPRKLILVFLVVSSWPLTAPILLPTSADFNVDVRRYEIGFTKLDLGTYQH